MNTKIKNKRNLDEKGTEKDNVNKMTGDYGEFVNSFDALPTECEEDIYWKTLYNNNENYGSKDSIFDDFFELENGVDYKEPVVTPNVDSETQENVCTINILENRNALKQSHFTDAQELLDLLSQQETLINEMTNILVRGYIVPSVEACFEVEDDRELLSPAKIIGNMINLFRKYLSLTVVTDLLKSLSEILVQDTRLLVEHYIIDYSFFWLNNVHDLYSFVVNIAKEYRRMTDNSNEYLESVLVIENWEMILKNLYSRIYSIAMDRIHSIIIRLARPGEILAKATPDLKDDNYANNLDTLVNANYPDSIDIAISLLNNSYWRMKSLRYDDDVINKIMIELVKYVDCIYFNSIMLSAPALESSDDLFLFMNLVKLNTSIEYYRLPCFDPLPLLNEVGRLRSLSQYDLERVENIEQLSDKLTGKQLQIALIKWKYQENVNPKLYEFLNKSPDLSSENISAGQDILLPIPKVYPVKIFDEVISASNFSKVFIPFTIAIDLTETLLKGLATECQVLTSFIGMSNFFNYPIDQEEECKISFHEESPMNFLNI